MDDFRIGQDGTSVVLVKNGRLVASLPWQAALDLSRALHIKAKAAEELDKVDIVIADQAMLVRSGAPIGVTSNPAMLKEAAKEAAWNPKLRKYMPGGVKSKAIVGRPTITQHPPKEGNTNGKE